MISEEIRIPQAYNEHFIFDLDGTLIKGDIGETTFLYLKSDGLFETKTWDGSISQLSGTEGNAKVESIYQYLDFVAAGQLKKAYLYTSDEIAKYQAEVIHKAVAKFLKASDGNRCVHFKIPNGGTASEFTVNYGVSIRRNLTQLVKRLQELSAQLWIVSASPQYVVDACGMIFGIEPHHIYGAFPSDNAAMKARFPWKSDKVKVLQQAGVANPLAVFGNGMEDLEMLTLAKIPVVMGDGHPELLDLAKERGWHILTEDTDIIIEG
jgi:phosphoserine phosphatase